MFGALVAPIQKHFERKLVALGGNGHIAIRLVFYITLNPKLVGNGLYITRLHYLGVVDPRDGIITGMTRDGTFLVEGGRIVAGVRNFRFNVGLMEMLSNVDAFSAPVRASGEETFDMVVPAMKVRGFNFTEVTRF